ncbi:MAG: TetR/AcrR family transcriptional regulator [Cyanobacteria bacterium J06621_11]
MSQVNSSERTSELRRKPQQQRSQQRMEEILTAAATVFWEVGYDAATTRDIAQQARTAVGTLYRFFPNKLAIFHALEKLHRQSVDSIHANLMSPEFVRQPLEEMVCQMVETYAIYFEDLRPRVVYTLYYTHPELYSQFNEAVDHSYIQRFAIALRTRNPTFSVARSELIAEVCHRTFNALFVSALKSDPHHRDKMYQELQRLLISYLRPYDTTSVAATLPLEMSNGSQVSPQALLSQRQQQVLSYLRSHKHINIQTFEKLCPERSRRTLQRDLKQLVASGHLQPQGDTNQLVYVLAERTER